MKIRVLLSGCLSFVLVNTSQAQAPASKSCLSERHSQALEAPAAGQSSNRALIEQQIQQFINQQKSRRQAAGPVIKIPVVVHVVTEMGCNGISKAQIQNGLEILNQDFRRQNPDTANTRAIFKPYAADTEIEFVLARKDPSGWETEGINRVTSPAAKGANPRDEVKLAAPAWPTDKYFNIWLVDNIYDSQAGANVLGYAQFPHVQLLNTFGVVLVHTQWGKQGAVPGSTATTNGHNATHEIAHCLHLMHTESTNCTDADLVADTPPAQFPSSTTGCNFNQNTCTNDQALGWPTDMPDMIENYMSFNDYACMNMFTTGQKMRMQAALSIYPHLANLVSPANAVFTGIDPAAMVNGPGAVPFPYFCASAKRVCAGGSITYNSLTYNAQATSITWSFPGGSPATSTDPNPVVTYNTPGTYDVVMTATNPIGSRTIYNNSLVKVVSTNNLINVSAPNYYVEGFEETAFPVSITANRTWEKATSSLATNPENWTRVGNAYSNLTNGVGVNSVRLQNANLPAGTISTFITPNFTGLPAAVFMEMAYAKRAATTTDALRVFYSYDCGVTWNGPVKTLIGNQLVTNGGAIVNNFVPATADWRIENILNAGQTGPIFANASHVMFKIEVTSNSGGNLYIDNFSIGNILGVKEDPKARNISVYPNPLTAETEIRFELKTPEKGSVKVLDMLGKTVYSGPETTFAAGSHNVPLAGNVKAAGVYVVQLTLNGKTYNTKLLVQ